MRRPPRPVRRSACLLLAVVLAGGCASRRPPVHPDLLAREARQPVVLIPGITGSRLRDPGSGKLRWGNGKSLFLPRDGGYSMAVPIAAAAPGESDLEVDGAVRAIRILGLMRLEFYGPLIRLMEANGYRLGDLDDPRREDSFFVFDHDWRYGAVRSAADLEHKLERLRRVRGEEVLTVDVIGHSNAARVARYFIKYGGASLESAEEGAGPPASVEVDQLILVGTDNGGALSILRILNRGRRYFPLIGRRIRPEALFAYESLYESLPAYREDVFFDREGRSLGVDLFDPGSWRRYGWGIYGPGVERRVGEADRDDLFPYPEERSAFLAGVLDRALRLQRLLKRDVEPFRTRYYLVQNDERPTGVRALLIEREGEWRTRFAGDRPVKGRTELSALASAPGDGHASVRSQMWLSPQEAAAIVGGPVQVSDRHRRIIRHPETQRHILDFLADGGAAKTDG